MWKILRIIFLMKFHFIYGKLVGDHICLTEESYLVNVTESYVRNITIRSYQWCYNVPPRCSYYTTKQINDTRLVEKNDTRTVEKCCAGFIETENRCISACLKCEFGVCEDGKCLCNPGFKGNSCDEACDVGEWGSNCSKRCDCHSGGCDASNGICTRTVFENGTEETVQSAPTTDETVQVNSPTIPMTKIENKTVGDISIIPELTTSYEITEQKTEFSSTTTSKTNSFISTPPNSSSSTFSELSTELEDSNNFSTTQTIPKITLPELNSADKGKDGPLRNLSEPNKIISKFTNSTFHQNTNHKLQQSVDAVPSSDSNKGILIPVGIKYDQLPESFTKNKIIPTTEENYLLVSREEFTKKNASSKEQEAAINLLTIVAISVFIVVVLVIAMMGMTRVRRTKRKEELRKEINTSGAVSYITTSIFHTPLPEPPVTENPLYLTPIKCRSDLKEIPSFETRIVCSMNSNRPTSDCREYLYDHPPSTGSYRAASLVEPLDVINRNPNIEQIPEPVYDEIPFRKDSEQPHDHERTYQTPKPLSIYVNTCGRTKF